MLATPKQLGDQMKANLKTLPKWTVTQRSGEEGRIEELLEIEAWAKATLNWFSEFEKELRDFIAYWKKLGCDGSHLMCLACAKILAYKEILGE